MKHPDGRWLTFPSCSSQYPKGTYFNILKLAGRLIRDSGVVIPASSTRG